MTGGGRRCNPALGPRGPREARLGQTPAPPGWAHRPPPRPGTHHRSLRQPPHPSTGPRRWRRGEKIESPRLRLVPGLSSYTKSETGEDGIEAVQRQRACSSNIDGAPDCPRAPHGGQGPGSQILWEGPAAREGRTPNSPPSSHRYLSVPGSKDSLVCGRRERGAGGGLPSPDQGKGHCAPPHPSSQSSPLAPDARAIEGGREGQDQSPPHPPHRVNSLLHTRLYSNVHHSHTST